MNDRPPVTSSVGRVVGLAVTIALGAAAVTICLAVIAITINWTLEHI